MKRIFDGASSFCRQDTQRLEGMIATRLQEYPAIAILAGRGSKGELARALALQLPQAVLYGEGGYALADYEACQPVVVDGLDEYDCAIDVANGAPVFRIALDLPCGLNEKGKANGNAFCAHLTLVCGGLRVAHLCNDGADYCGELTVLQEQTSEPIARLYTDEDFVMPPRKRNTHKGNYGKIAVLGGSERFPSAPLFTASAALRCGAGLVTLYAPKSYASFYAAHADRGYTLDFIGENNLPVFDFDTASRIAQSDVIVMGMGMGNNETTKQYVSYFLRRFDGILVLDADALNVVAGDLDLLQDHKPTLILTPHVGEYGRLFGKDEVTVSDVKEIAGRYGITLAVKSCSSVISDGKEVWITNSGTPALARGGSGDSLAGIVAAFAALTHPLSAVVRACHLFGRAGEESERIAGNALSPSPLETIDCIPDCLSALTKHSTY